MGKIINSAIVGCGSIYNVHADAIASLDYAGLAAVCDINAQRAEYAGGICNTEHVYTDYKRLIEEIHPDILHVCLPHYLHMPVTVAALERGISVLCEKPLAITASDAKKMLDTANSHNALLGVVYQNRFNITSQFIKRALDDGVLGKVKAGRFYVTWMRDDEYYAQSDWRGTLDLEGGGVIINQSIHTFDLVRWLIGAEVLSVDATLSNRNHKSIEVEDTVDGVIYFDGGSFVQFQVNTNYGYDAPIFVELVCENGIACINGDVAEIKLNSGEILSSLQNDRVELQTAKSYWGAGHSMLIKNFYESFINKTEPYVTSEEGYLTQLLIDKVYSCRK